jgi:hypothetical protein
LLVLLPYLPGTDLRPTPHLTADFSGPENRCRPAGPLLSWKRLSFRKRREEPVMAEPPALDDVLRNALSGIDDEDVRLFYSFFDELKRSAWSLLRRKARAFPGESAVAHSALLSVLADVSVGQIPLADTDEAGGLALWPLLLKYLERHCNKWNKYYRAKKRQGKEVSLGGQGESPAALDPADPGPSPAEEAEFADAWELLEKKLKPRQYQVATLAAQGRTLEEIAQALGCSETTVSNDKKAIRQVLEVA